MPEFIHILRTGLVDRSDLHHPRCMLEHSGAPPGPPENSMPPITTMRSPLIAREDAFDSGLSADDIKRRIRAGEWVVLRPGTYVPASTLESLSAVRRHLLQIDAELPRSAEHAVVSHLSAACEHGIDLLKVPHKTVQVTNPMGVSGHRRPLLHTFRASLDDDEWVRVRGHKVTDPARTVIDVARTRPFEEGVVAADSALRSGLVTPDELTAAADRAPRRAGMRTARRVIMFADRRAASVGESKSRVLMAGELLPPPELQFRVADRAGGVFALTDFGWREFNTVGEFDGAQKYGRLLRPGERAGDRIFQEKIREDRIRDTGLQVVRWTWHDLADPKDLAERIRRALDRGMKSACAYAAPRI